MHSLLRKEHHLHDGVITQLCFYINTLCDKIDVIEAAHDGVK